MPSSPFVLDLATRVQSISALSFSAFLAMHLAAPLAAALQLDANGVMLLTREYYQTSLLEPVLVWGSLGLHLLSSATRRILLGPPKKPSAHSLTGYLLVPLIAAHSVTHRIFPARRGLSPSLLSYSFVSYSLAAYPVLSWLSYGVLSILTGYHSITGLRKVLSGRRKAAVLPDNTWKASYALLLSGLGLGIANLASEGADVPIWLGKRYAELLREMYGF